MQQAHIVMSKETLIFLSLLIEWYIFVTETKRVAAGEKQVLTVSIMTQASSLTIRILTK